MYSLKKQCYASCLCGSKCCCYFRSVLYNWQYMVGYKIWSKIRAIWPSDRGLQHNNLVAAITANRQVSSWKELFAVNANMTIEYNGCGLLIEVKRKNSWPGWLNIEQYYVIDWFHWSTNAVVGDLQGITVDNLFLDFLNLNKSENQNVHMSIAFAVLLKKAIGCILSRFFLQSVGFPAWRLASNYSRGVWVYQLFACMRFFLQVVLALLLVSEKTVGRHVFLASEENLERHLD